MKKIKARSVTLPKLKGIPTDQHNVSGVLWFPDTVAKTYWQNVTKWPDTNELVLRAHGYSMALQIAVGSEVFNQLGGNLHRIISLPPTGTSGKRFYRWLTSSPDHSQNYFARIFQPKELARQPGEESPIKALWRDVRENFSISPFLALAEDRKSNCGLEDWLAWVIILANLHTQHSELITKLQRFERQARKLLQNLDEVPKNIDCMDTLVSLIALRAQGHELHDGITKAEEGLKQKTRCLEEYSERFDSLILDRYETTGKSVYGVDFVINLGEELAPDLQTLGSKLAGFADKLVASNNPDLKNLGDELQIRLQQRLPVLAFIGSFSSGKTTLLNTLIIGKKTKRSFRTSTVANTAIVSEIRSCEENGKENVQFQFREKINHMLIEPDDKSGATEFTLPRNIEHLKELVTSNILKSPQIHYAQDGDERVVKGRKAVLEFLEKDVFVGNYAQADISANVNLTGLRRGELENRLPEKIDLTTDEGWEKFQGDEKGKRPCVEEIAATFLIERADIQLQNPLLDITTIADTPGTGSRNDRHDVITDEYLNRAEGFIVLLPTKNFHASRVQEIIVRVRDEFDQRYKGQPAMGLNSVAFVVNCFSNQEEEIVIRRIEEFAKMICKEFGLKKTEWKRRQSDPQTRNFFAVNLKHVEEQAQNLETHYEYPSLIPLRKWIKRLFVSGAYGERLNQMLNIIDGDWRIRRRELDKRKRELNQSASKLSERVGQIKIFREGKLNEITQRYRRQINNIVDEIHSGNYSLRAEGNKCLDSYVADPLDKDSIDTWRFRLRKLYRELNGLLDDLENTDPAKGWAEEIKRELKIIAVSPPSLVPPDPQSQKKPWSSRRRFNSQSVDRKFREIKDRWPKKIKHLWERIKDRFGREDIRKIMAREVRYSFWPAQYNAIWDERLEKYLNRCDGFITRKEREVKAYCVDRENDLRNTDFAGKKRILEKIEKVFNSFDEERKQLILELEQGFTEKRR